MISLSFLFFLGTRKIRSNNPDIPELFPTLPPSKEDWRLPLPAADLEAAGRRLDLATELVVL